MTSQINPNNIDGNYPVAGVPNNTQGFRDNFTNIQTNFQYATDEITELQNKAVLKAAITGSTLDNNMNDALISAVTLNDVGYTVVNNTATSGTITVDYSAGTFQTIATTGNISLSFTNWPESGIAGSLILRVQITNTAYTMTLPTAVSQGIQGLEGYNAGVVSFGATGYYYYQFVTLDGGTTIEINDWDRPITTYSFPVTISNTTPSTSKTTGALVVSGGVGIGSNLNVGGNLSTYTSTGNVAFSALDNGFIEFFTPAVPGNTAGALNIVGSANRSYQPVINTGSMIHITGNDSASSRITNDAFGTGVSAVITMRQARGTAQTPTATQSGDILARLTASGWGTTNYVLDTGNVSPTSIEVVALENYTDSAAGSKINFYTAPTGSKTKTLSANITSSLTTFASAVSAIGNVTAGNITTAGNIWLSDGGTVGYNNGAGGTVSQSGNKSGGVTLNKPSGEITMQNTNLAAATTVSFTLTNSTIGPRDLLILNIVGGVVTPAAYNLDANCTSGSAVISVRNITAGTLGEAIVLRYAVIRGSIA